VQILIDGEADTGAGSLTERKAYVKEHVVVAKKQEYSGSTLVSEEEYDENGSKVKTLLYDNGTVNSWTEYTYDDAGNMIKSVQYNAEGNVTGWGEFAYDDVKNMMNATYYDADGSIIKYREERYDESGNLTRYTDYDSAGTVLDWCEYENFYDSAGNLTDLYYSHNDNFVDWEYDNTYDEEGNLIYYTVYNFYDGTLIEEWERDAFDNGIVVRGNGYTYTYEYQYVGE
jgi:hypothetical protein